MLVGFMFLVLGQVPARKLFWYTHLCEDFKAMAPCGYYESVIDRWLRTSQLDTCRNTYGNADTTPNPYPKSYSQPVTHVYS
jgi:hypothetical protein